MALQLTIVKSPEGVSLTESSKVFTDQGGVIGRATTNDWVLSDPDRFLSSRHCEVVCEGGSYFLTDLSTNGTFVNGSPEPLGKGARTALSDGDTFDLGDYSFQVSLVGDQGGVSSPFGGVSSPSSMDDFASPSLSDFGSAEPFGGGADPLSDLSLNPEPENVDPLAALDSAKQKDLEDPFAAPAGGVSSSGADLFQSSDPFAAKPASDPFQSAGNLSDGAAPLEQAVSMPGISEPNLIPEGWDDDFGGGSSSQPQSFPGSDAAFSKPLEDSLNDAKQQRPAVAPPMEDPFANPSFPNADASLSTPSIPDSWDQPSAPNSVPAPQPSKPIPPAESGFSAGLDIEDASPFDVDSLGGNSGFSSPAIEEPAPGAPLESGFGEQKIDVSAPHRSVPLTDPPKTPKPASPAPSPTPRPQAQAKKAEARPPQDAAKKPRPRKPNKEAVANKRGMTSVKSGIALIEAMGLDSSTLSDEQVTEISETAGKLMREIVEGMMQVLRSRASIKNEFRMNVTTIQPVENNPLKFSANADEAIERMFISKNNAYKKPVEAFEEGFNGIAEHQIAIIAGIRFAFESMMERFNPETLEKNFDKQAKGGILPGMQKAKYWSLYREYYQGFVDNMEHSFQHLFGEEFVSAYEDQLRKLVASRKKKDRM